MLEVNQLSRFYGSFSAVSDVSFSIGSGEIVGLLGHNGAGKTTIMKMLSGYLEPSQGSVRLKGLDLTKENNQAQQLLGYLPENLPVYPEMRVADYLDYAAELKGLSGEAKAASIRRAVQSTDIQLKLFDPISTLSRGYKQRVGVAQAILGSPKLLILDEPTNGLDPTQTEHMRALIREIAQDATVILSTHIMQEVDALCDRALILRRGELVVDASLNELRHSNVLLVGTSAKSDAFTPLCKGLNAIENIEALTADDDSHQRYRLTLKSDHAPADVASQVAQLLIKNDLPLHLLHPQQRDLESLFREVSDVHEQPTTPVTQEKDVSHAA